MLNNKMIGNKIADARKRISISQAQLGESLFITSQAVGKWERGESMPDILTLIRLAEILGVDLNYFSESYQSVSAESSGTEPVIKQGDELPSPKQKKRLLWDMSRGNWMDADFSGLKNLHEKFSSSNMLNCKFAGSELSGLILKGNNVAGCDFTGSLISNSRIQSSNLADNLFKDCFLKETEFSDSYIIGCDFSGADFSGACFKSGGFQDNPIEKAVWNCTSFAGMQIADIVFDGTIQGCAFENCAFKRVTFSNARLTDTFFKNKNLKGIRFIDCTADRITYEFLKNGRADLNGITKLES